MSATMPECWLARVPAGSALFIPRGWWHHVTSHATTEDAPARAGAEAGTGAAGGGELEEEGASAAAAGRDGVCTALPFSAAVNFWWRTEGDADRAGE
jgi:hypothetical protein